MRIKILDTAERDLVIGHNFYEGQAPGLGEYFIDSIISDIESLHLYQGIHEKQFGYYRLLSKRFPFAIYYRVDKETIRVYAVLDCRKDPAANIERLN